MSTLNNLNEVTGDSAMTPSPRVSRLPDVLGDSVPVLLRAPQNVGQMIFAFMGMLAGGGVAGALIHLAPRNSMLGHMFNIRSLDTLVPSLISIMFCCGLVVCLFRFLRLSAIRRISRQRDWNALMAFAGTSCPAEIAAATGTRLGHVSPLFRRVHAIARQWQANAGLIDADIINQQLADEDSDAVHAGYGMLRMFIWALPVLGLIGTVIGISMAVGGFASFLGGEIDDVGIIKKSLVSVTSGLSFAFLITLLGLATSLVLMFIVSALQSREERFFTWVKSRTTDDLLVCLQRIAPSQKYEMATSAVSITAEQIAMTAARVFEVVDATAQKVLQGVQREESAMRERMTSWLAIQQAEFQGAASKIATALTSSLQGISAVNSQCEAAAAGSRQQTQAFMEQLHAVLGEHTLALRHTQQLAIEATREQNAAVKSNFEAISDIAKSTQNTLAAQASLQQAIAAIDHSALQVAFAGLRDAMGAQSRDIRDATEHIREWQSLARQVISSQASLHEATAQLKQAQLTETLASFRDSLVDLKPVLSSFRKPFVLQAVPVDGKN